MQPGERFSLFVKISLPLLILALLQVTPQSLDIASRMREAQAAQNEGRHQAAAEALRAVVDREPWRVTLWEQIGREQLAAGQVEQAIASLLDASQKDALSAQGWFILGEAYQQQSEYSRAEAIWEELLKKQGPSDRVFERLAQLQRDQRNFAAAINTLRAWRAFDSHNPQVAFLLGMHLSVEKPDEALPLLLEAAQADAKLSPSVQVLRGGLGLAASSDDPAYGRLMIGRSLGSLAQWDLAAEAFRQSTALAPNYGEAWAFLGEARSHLGAQGTAELEKARTLAPNSSVVNALYALSLRRQGKYQDALGYLQTIALQEPKEPIWQVEIGNTLVDLGDLTSAREYFEKAIALSPNDPQYYEYLAGFSVQYNVDIRGLGLPAARTAVLLTEDDPSALDIMGWTLANLGDSTSAERFLQRALESDATYAPANLHLGQLYLQQQDAERAYPCLKRAANLAGASQVGETARRLLQRYFGEGG